MSIGERCYWGLRYLEVVSTQFDKEPDRLSNETQGELKGMRFSLNPAGLRQGIEAKPERLVSSIMKTKGKSQQVDPRKIVPNTVTAFMILQAEVGLPG